MKNIAGLFTPGCLAAALLFSHSSMAQEVAQPPQGFAAVEALAQDQKPAASALKDAADLDYTAFQQALRPKPPKDFQAMTRSEMNLFMEEHGMDLRRRALTFLAEHPDDPRRWSIVSRLDPSAPNFVLQWAENDADVIVDEVAQAAWKARVQGLKEQMKTATDLPEDVGQMLAMQTKMEAEDAALMAKWSSGKEAAPDFTTQDLAGKPVKISDYRGKVIVLDFWATWCGPCKAALPHVQALAKKYAKEGVVVLASATSDKREDFEKFVRENREKYPNLIWSHDQKERKDFFRNTEAARLYGVKGIPAQFIIDRKGRVVDMIVGYSEGEVILEGALTKAGIKVDEATRAQAAADLKKRGS